METKIELKNIHKSFGKLHVLKGINLKIREGEVVVLIGPSGSGKSTLIRCINLLEIPEKGEILIDGQRVGTIWNEKKKQNIPDKESNIVEIRRKVGMVFQQFNLFPHKTVLQNIMEGLVVVKRLKTENAKEIAKNLLEKVGLIDKSAAYPSEISGGQQQRVAIARALAMQPEIMLFDEPTSSLDPELIGGVLEVMKQLVNEHNMTMIIVTHEIGFAKDAANRILMMDNGAIIEEGSPDKIINNPANERTKKFLGQVKRIEGNKKVNKAKF